MHTLHFMSVIRIKSSTLIRKWWRWLREDGWVEGGMVLQHVYERRHVHILLFNSSTEKSFGTE